MFSKHVTGKLSAYCHGELTKEEARRVAAHLLACRKCQGEHEEIKLGIRLAERLPQVSAPDSLWNDIEAALNQSAQQPATELKSSWFAFGPFGWSVAAASLALVLAVTVIAVRYYQRAAQPSGPSWEVERLAGVPRTDSGRISDKGRLHVGETLVTDESARARIEVADIGHVEVEPKTRVRLLETSATEHRLALDRGRMEAIINAPPRLFFVNVPSAVAVDLGCAYTLEVDDLGRSFLHVTGGWVMLMRDGREVYVPRYAMCEVRPGVGPGTPYFEDASDKLVEALERFDFEDGGDEALNTVLAESRERDTFTLWHLIQRVDESRRARVLDRMIELVPLPAGVTREGVMSLDKNMLEYWKEEFDLVWF
ncbi:MAG TPA: zf-HC2 domain-containing protein [Blastocatellia bacterium]|nr:zf-HC2 domain-containing protein [Blastocatellia bacterium]